MFNNMCISGHACAPFFRSRVGTSLRRSGIRRSRGAPSLSEESDVIPKLRAKIGLVVLLTAKGVLLHRVVMPLLQKAGSLLRLSFNDLLLAMFAGTGPAVTWFNPGSWALAGVCRGSTRSSSCSPRTR